jgi:pyroglutamyl-peptidase
LRTILITGFGRFAGSPLNPSGLVAMRLVGRRRPAFAETRRIAHVFATRYDAVDRELPALLARERPDVVVMFGVAPRSHLVRVEERARNRIALFPDAGGYRPTTHTIAAGQDARRNPLGITRVVKAARAAGVPAAPSRNAGAYLCNYAYWRALEAAAGPDGPRAVIFIHLPPIRLASGPRKLFSRPAKKPLHKRQPRKHLAPHLNDLVRAGEAIVLAMNALTAVRR